MASHVSTCMSLQDTWQAMSACMGVKLCINRCVRRIMREKQERKEKGKK